MTNELSPADIRACCANDNNGMFGNDSWAWIIILLLFGYGGRGFGFGGAGGGCGAPATQADVRSAVDQQTLISKLDQQTYGLADTTYTLNNALTNGFYGVNTALCNLGFQNQQGFATVNASIERCCCNAEKMNMQSRFDAQAYNCDTLRAIDRLGDRIIDFMTCEKTQALRDENQALRLAASQAKQNQYLIEQLKPTTTA